MNFPFQLKTARNAKTPEEQDVIQSLKEIRRSLNCVYDRINYSADELITDSLSYELLSLNSRHKFYIQKARELRIKYSDYIDTEVRK